MRGGLETLRRLLAGVVRRLSCGPSLVSKLRGLQELEKGLTDLKALGSWRCYASCIYSDRPLRLLATWQTILCDCLESLHWFGTLKELKLRNCRVLSVACGLKLPNSPVQLPLVFTGSLLGAPGNQFYQLPCLTLLGANEMRRTETISHASPM